MANRTSRGNVNSLYDHLFTIKQMLAEVVQTAIEASQEAEILGGKVAEALIPLLKANFINQIKTLAEGDGQGTIKYMVSFLDNMPMGSVRNQGVDALLQDQYSGTEGASSGFGSMPEPAKPGSAVSTEEPAGPQSAILAAKESSSRLSGLLRQTRVEEQVELEDHGQLDFNHIRSFEEGYHEETGLSPYEEYSDDRIFMHALEKATNPHMSLARRTAAAVGAGQNAGVSSKLKEDILMGTLTPPQYDTHSRYREPAVAESTKMTDWRSLVAEDAPISGETAGDLARKLMG